MERHKVFSMGFLISAWRHKMDEIFLFSTVIMTGISGLLLIVSIASLYRLKQLKLMFASLAFLFFFHKSSFITFRAHRTGQMYVNYRYYYPYSSLFYSI